MAGGDKFMKPSERGKRDPLSNEKMNGRISNPPRFAELGGLKNKTRGFNKNNMTINKPGGSAS